MTKQQLYLLLLLLGSNGEKVAARSLKRRLGDITQGRTLHEDEHLNEEETEIAILTRHSEEPEERNIFVQPSPPAIQPIAFPSVFPSILPTVDSPDASLSPSNQPSGQVTEGPSRSFQPSVSPSLSQRPSVEGDIALEQFLFDTLTNDGSLTIEGTPQNQAFVALSATNPELDPSNPDDQVQITQRYALNTLYFATGGTNWANNRLWTSPEPICGQDVDTSWYGVVCNTNENAVNIIERLSLAGNDLLGQIPSEIQGLSSLSKFAIDNHTLKETKANALY